MKAQQQLDAQWRAISAKLAARSPARRLIDWLADQGDAWVYIGAIAILLLGAYAQPN